MVCEWLVSFNNWKYRNRYINSWQIISTKERENTQRIAKVSVRAYVLLYAHTNGSWAIAFKPSRISCRLEFFVIIDAPHITQRLVYNVHIAIGFDFFKKKTFLVFFCWAHPKRAAMRSSLQQKKMFAWIPVWSMIQSVFFFALTIDITIFCNNHFFMLSECSRFPIRWLTQFEISHASIDVRSSLLYSNFSTKSEFSSSITSACMKLFAVRMMLNCIGIIWVASTLCIFVVFQCNFICTERLLYRVDKLKALSMPANLKKPDARY